MIKNILAIETSCDDTSVSVVSAEGQVLSLVSRSQDLAHEPYGGIVPEIASRNHTAVLIPLIEEALVKSQCTWDHIDGIAVTNRPGLIGALIVGVMTAKSLAQVLQKPLIGVNHLEGHLFAPFLRDENYKPGFDWNQPFVALAISGGHTSLYHVKGLGQYYVLGRTKDDAAGEAFDKFAKMVGLGFPGGQRVDKESAKGNPKSYDFPRSMLLDSSLDMSFSGLKSAAQRRVQEWGPEKVQNNLADLCASYQEAIVDILVNKMEKAAQAVSVKKLVLTGGVSANSRLREKMSEMAQEKGFELLIPPLKYCTDNAAMIGYVGALRLSRGERHDMSLSPSPQVWSQDFQ